METDHAWYGKNVVIYSINERVLLMRFIEELFDVIERHRCGKPILIKGRYLFRNGAQSDLSGTSHLNPPDYKWQRIALQKEFVEYEINREKTEFYQFQGTCTEQAGLAARYSSCPPPPADAPEQLERGRERIRMLQDELDAINAELERSPAARQKARNAQLEHERQRHANNLNNKIFSISLD